MKNKLKLVLLLTIVTILTGCKIYHPGGTKSPLLPQDRWNYPIMQK